VCRIKIPYTKHIFEYIPESAENIEVRHITDVGSSPFLDLNIVVIELRGCPTGDIRVRRVIEQGALVIIRVRLSSESVSKSMLPKVPHHISFFIEGINVASVVHSDCDVYPINLDSTVPIFNDLSDPEVCKRVRNHRSILEYIGKPPSTAGSERCTNYKLV
jgi:hypothetical protein